MTFIPPADAGSSTRPHTPSFGAIVRLETGLQAFTGAAAAHAASSGISEAMVHALRRQYASLAVNITLLEVQCETAPTWGLGESSRHAVLPPAFDLPIPKASEVVNDLVSQHQAILAEIEALLKTPAGHNAELVLAEVCSRHREMLRILAVLGIAIENQSASGDIGAALAG